MTAKLPLAVAVLFSFVMCAESSSKPVPALIWSPEKSMSEHEASLDGTFGPEEFHDQYLSPLLLKGEPMAAVLFLQDKLHSDDFTHFADVYSIDSQGGAFANIKTLMEENFSLELPQVSEMTESIKKLRNGFKGQVHSVSSLNELEKLDLQPSQFLLVVELPSTAQSLDREQALQANDAMIGEVCKHLAKRSIPYSAVYTGLAATEEKTPEASAYNARHLLAAQNLDVNGTFMNISDGESFLFLRDIYICVKNTGNADCVANFTLVPTPDSAIDSIVANDTAMIELSFQKVAPGNSQSGEYNITIITDAINEGDRWVIKRISLNIIPEDKQASNNTAIDNGTLSSGEMDFVVPILYSFHCTEMRMNLYTLGDNNDLKDFVGSYVVFNGFQFQPFNIQQNRFFNSVDCVGFFTSAIWMGIFPVAILLAILTYGTMMLLNLSIMDRYDDPKGKTISVHAASE